MSFLSRFGVVIFLLTCVVLFVVSYVVAAGDVLTTPKIPVSENTGYSVTITSPKSLAFDSDPDYRRPLIVQVEPSQEVALGVAYTLTVSADDNGVLLLDGMGQSLETGITVTGETPAPAIAQVHVQRRLFGPGSRQGVVKVTVSAGIIYRNLDLIIPFQTERQTKFRRFWQDFLGPAGLGQIILAVVGLAVAWQLARYEGNREREAKLEELRQLFYAHSPEAMKHIAELESNIQRSGWEELQKQRFHNVQTGIVQSRKYQTAVLCQLGDDLAAGEKAKAGDLLGMCKTCFPEKLSRHFATLQECIQRIRQAHLPTSEDMDVAIDACLCLWDEYTEDAREAIVPFLVQIGEQEDGRKKIGGRFDGDGRQKYGALLRDQRLKGIIDELDIPDYRWLDLKIELAEVGVDPKIAEWLTRHHHLERHPFAVWQAEADSILSATWLPPSWWETNALADRSTIFVSPIAYDRVASARKLYDDIRRAPGKMGKSFPLICRLPLSHKLFGSDQRAVLQSLVHVVGAAWIDLVAGHPEALLGLPRAEQANIARFLAWVAGSHARLLTEVRQRSSTAETDHAQQRLTISLSELLVSFPQMSEPSPTTLLSWLCLRPASTSRTFLVAYSADNEHMATCAEQASYLLGLTDMLALDQVFLKLFLSKNDHLFDRSSQIEDIRWEPGDIAEFIDQRIVWAATDELRRSRGGGMKFSDLFAESSISRPNEKLAQWADGSLWRALHLAGKLIEFHALQTPDEGYLTSDDWRAVF